MAHLDSLGKLLQEDEYYVKEACLQLLSALGPLALRHCITQILAILDDEDEEEEVRRGIQTSPPQRVSHCLHPIDLRY